MSTVRFRRDDDGRGGAGPARPGGGGRRTNSQEMGRAVLASAASHVVASAATAAGDDASNVDERARSETAKQVALSGSSQPSGMSYPWPSRRFDPDAAASPDEMLALERDVIAENQRKGFAEETAFAALTPEQRFVRIPPAIGASHAGHRRSLTWRSLDVCACWEMHSPRRSSTFEAISCCEATTPPSRLRNSTPGSTRCRRFR